MKRTRSTQRGFFAIGIAIALAAGFGLGGWGLVELADSDAQAVAEQAEHPSAVAANAGDSAGTY
ncbi:MAG TPA: hypothetical protein VLD36_21625 [Burkholderiales bacterium]|jgi:hypothetical protein|nr:hypothetical protein [Burkholderiales bacterium]